MRYSKEEMAERLARMRRRALRQKECQMCGIIYDGNWHLPLCRVCRAGWFKERNRENSARAYAKLQGMSAELKEYRLRAAARMQLLRERRKQGIG